MGYGGIGVFDANRPLDGSSLFMSGLPSTRCQLRSDPAHLPFLVGHGPVEGLPLVVTCSLRDKEISGGVCRYVGRSTVHTVLTYLHVRATGCVLQTPFAMHNIIIRRICLYFILASRFDPR